MDDQRIDWLAHYEFSAPAWERWADALAAQQEKINAQLLEAAGIGPGQLVLDLASGAGEPALQAAQRVGATGRVVATDASPGMLDVLARRAAAAGLANVEPRLAGMARLPYEASQFDAVVCRYGIMYAPEPEAVLRECLRVLRPGGRVAMMVWGTEADNTTLYVPCRALQAAFPSRVSEAQMVAPLRFGEAGRLAAVFAAAGVEAVVEHELTLAPRIRRGTPFWKPLVEMNLGEVWSTLAPAERAAVSDAVAVALEPYVDGEHYALRTSMRIVSGQRSG